WRAGSLLPPRFLVSPTFRLLACATLSHRLGCAITDPGVVTVLTETGLSSPSLPVYFVIDLGAPASLGIDSKSISTFQALADAETIGDAGKGWRKSGEKCDQGMRRVGEWDRCGTFNRRKLPPRLQLTDSQT